MTKILFISTSSSPDDRRAWSGTVYQALKGLQKAGFEVDYLSALRDYKQNFVDKLLCTYWLRVPGKFNKMTRMDESFYTVRIFKQTLDNFDYSPYDVIFVPTHIAIVNAIPKSIKSKIVHLVDATVDSLFDYYSEFSNLWFHNYWEAHYLGKMAFKRSDLIIASNNWCKNNAIKQYGIPYDRLAVIEFGANIDMDDIPAIPKNYDGSKPLKIYWCGVNWVRKGGDIAVEACKELIERGIQVELHITGMRELPQDIDNHSWIHNHGFLDKNNPSQYRRLIDLMTEMDIFLFPSRAECSSIALCEANGFGLPCFVYDTGGTANYVHNGFNGYMLPLSATGKEFAERIYKSLTNSEINRLSRNARNKFENSLNWDVWSEKVKKAMQILE